MQVELGTQGVSLAPYCAQAFVEHLLFQRAAIRYHTKNGHPQQILILLQV